MIIQEELNLFEKPKKKTQCQLLLEFLQDRQWHNIIEMFQALKPGCINWAARSRISDLKKKGYHIESRIDNNRQASYRLI